MEMFYIVIWVAVTQVYEHTQLHQLRYVQYAVYKLYPSKNLETNSTS